MFIRESKKMRIEIEIEIPRPRERTTRRSQLQLIYFEIFSPFLNLNFIDLFTLKILQF